MKQDHLQTQYKKAEKILLQDGLVVLATDTIYGVVARADSAAALLSLRLAKKREDKKAFVVLCSSPSQLEPFGVDALQLSEAEKVWQSDKRTTCIVDTAQSWPLISGTNIGVGFRLVKGVPMLEGLLETVGPLAAPSANTQGCIPATTIDEAKSYFGDAVELYVDQGKVVGSPSSIVRVHTDGSTTIVRH